MCKFFNNKNTNKIQNKNPIFQAFARKRDCGKLFQAMNIVNGFGLLSV